VREKGIKRNRMEEEDLRYCFNVKKEKEVWRAMTIGRVDKRDGKTVRERRGRDEIKKEINYFARHL
jgi:hypothetical protein